MSSLTCVEEWLPLPPVLQVDENIEGGEEGEGKAGGDEDEGDAPQVLVDRHPAALLAATAEQSPQATSEKRPGHPTSETVSMPWVHLEEMLKSETLLTEKSRRRAINFVSDAPWRLQRYTKWFRAMLF